MKTYLVRNSTHTAHSVGATGAEPVDLPHGQHTVLELDDDAVTRHRNAGLSVTAYEPAPVEAAAAEPAAPAPKKRVRASRARSKAPAKK